MRSLKTLGLLARLVVIVFVSIFLGAFGAGLIREGQFVLGLLFAVLGPIAVIATAWRLLTHLWRHRKLA